MKPETWVSFCTIDSPVGCLTLTSDGAALTGVYMASSRVIGADGSLTGFGGGLPRKEWLLRHEGRPVTGTATSDLYPLRLHQTGG